MRVETNTSLIARSRKIAQYLFFGSFAVLILWLFVSTQTGRTTDQLPNFFTGVLIPAVLLPAAFVGSIISVRFTNLWVRLPRPEEAIRANLRAISPKSVLYNYYHIPARHVLIAPQGVYAMITRFQQGHYSVTNDVWQTYQNPISRLLSFLRFDRIGNPTLEAQRAAAHVQKLIDPIVPGITVQPLIVFVDARVVVDVQDSSVPVVFTSEQQPTLKQFLTAAYSKDKRMPLTPAQIAAFETATVRR